MTKEELITLFHKVEEKKGRMYLEYNSPREKGKDGITILTDLGVCCYAPSGIHFRLNNGFIDLYIPKQDDIDYTLEYDKEEECYDMYINDIRICFKIKKEIFEDIFKNLDSCSQDFYINNIVDDDRDSEIYIDGFWESIE